VFPGFRRCANEICPILGILCSAEWYSFLPTFRYNLSGPVFKGQAVQYEFRTKMFPVFLLVCLTIEYGTDRLYRNVGKELYHSALRKIPKEGAFVHRVSRISEYHKDRAIKSRMLWAGHVARLGESIGVYGVLVGKPEGKRPLGRRRYRWEDNIKIDLQEVGCGGHGLDRSGSG